MTDTQPDQERIRARIGLIGGDEFTVFLNGYLDLWGGPRWWEVTEVSGAEETLLLNSEQVLWVQYQ